MRPLHTLALLALAIALSATPALAATSLEVADALADRGYYVEPGAERVDQADLAEVLDEAPSPVSAVVLAEALDVPEEDFADEVLEDLGRSGTVVVVSPEGIGASSTEFDDAEVDRAFDDAERRVDFGSAGALEIIEAFTLALGGEGAQEPSEDRGGGVSVLPVLVVGGLGVLGATTLLGRRRRRRAEEEGQQRALDEARQEVREQVGVLADQILALTDRVELAGNPEAERLFAAATATYTKAQGEVDTSTSAASLEQVSDELNHARWQLESVTALVEGREPPPEPAHVEACFFDPTHGAGVEEATIETAAGGRAVRVCAACAAKLRAGQAPEPRMINVGGERIPAAMAPRSYGGGGIGGLSDFVFILGGSRLPFGWGGFGGGYGPYGGYGPFGMPRRRRYGGFGPMGGPFGGGYGGGGGFGGGGGYRRGGGGGWLGGGGGFGGGGLGGGMSSGGRTRGSAGRSRGSSFGGSRGSGGRSRGGGGRSRGGRRR